MRTFARIGRPIALAAAAATTLALVSTVGAPAASAATVSSVLVTVTIGGAPAAGAFVAVSTTQGEALGGTTTTADGSAAVTLRAAVDESTLRVVASSPDGLAATPASVAAGSATLDLAAIPASVSGLTYANTYGSQVEDLAGDGQSGVFYAITSTLPSVWRSSDYAGTWAATPTLINSPSSGLPQSRALQLVTSGFPGEVAVVLQGGPPDNAEQLWFSRDYGTTWLRVPEYGAISGTKTILWAHSATVTGPDSSYLTVASSTQGLMAFVMPSAANGLTAPNPPSGAVAGVAPSAQVALAAAPDGRVLLLVAGDVDATLSRLPVGLTSSAGLAPESLVTVPFFGRTTSDPTAIPQWGAEDVVRIASLATPDHVAVLVYDRNVNAGTWSGELKTAVVDLSVDPAVTVSNRSDAGTFALAMGNQSNGNNVDPVTFDAGETAIGGYPCGENLTSPVATLADTVPSGPAAGFGLVGSVRSCMVAFNATDSSVPWNGTGGSVAARTAAVIPVSGINNNVGFVFDSRFLGTNDAAENVEVAISGDGQFGVRKSAAFDTNGRFQFGGAVNTVDVFLDRRAKPGTAPDSGGVAVMGMVAPSVSDEVMSPTDTTGSTYLATLGSSGGAQVLLTTDKGATFSTVAVFGADRLAWWQGPADHQWILAEGWDRLRPKPFTTSAGAGPLDMAEELAATATQRNEPAPDGSPFLIPDTPAELGGSMFTYDSLIKDKQGRIMMTAMSGVPGTDRAVVGVSDGTGPQSLTRGTVALVDLTWPADEGTQADLRVSMSSMRYFGPDLPAGGTTTDAQGGFAAGRTSTYDARINAIATCPDVDGAAASVRDTAFVSVSGRGIDKITGVSGATPTWAPTGITDGNYRDLDVDCDTGVLVAAPDIPWAGPPSVGANRLVDVSLDGATTFTTITPSPSLTLPRVEGLSVAVAASSADNRLTIVVGGQSGVIAGLALQLSDIPAGGTDIEVPAELVQIVNGTHGRAVGMVSALDLPPAADDAVLSAASPLATGLAVPALGTGTPLAVGSGAGAFSTLARTTQPARTARITAPTSETLLASSVRVSWASTGVVRRYVVQRAIKVPGRALGAYATWTSTALPSAAMTGARAGYGYCFRVQAVSGSGATAWSTPRCATVPLDDRALVAGTGWVRATSRTAYLGTTTTSRRANAALTLKASRGSKLALVITKQPGGGTLAVYVGTRRVALVSTASARVAATSVVLLSVRTTGSSVVLRVYKTGTRGVIVDGIAQLP